MAQVHAHSLRKALSPPAITQPGAKSDCPAIVFGSSRFRY
jgi:hypothetical protein